MATYAEPVFERRTAVRRKTDVVTDRWSFMAPLGRALLSAIFILYGFPHLTAPTIGYAAHHGVPAAGSPVPAIMPESIGTPLTTVATSWLSCPVKVLPSGSVPVTGSVTGTGSTATAVVGAEEAALAVEIPVPTEKIPAMTAAVATAASTAFPPERRMCRPACAASGCEVATMFGAMTG